MPVKRTLVHSTDDARKAAKTGREDSRASSKPAGVHTHSAGVEVCYARLPRECTDSAATRAVLLRCWQHEQRAVVRVSYDQEFLSADILSHVFCVLTLLVGCAGPCPPVWRVRPHGPKPWSGADQVCSCHKLHVSYKHESRLRTSRKLHFGTQWKREICYLASITVLPWCPRHPDRARHVKCRLLEKRCRHLYSTGVHSAVGGCLKAIYVCAHA